MGGMGTRYPLEPVLRELDCDSMMGAAGLLSSYDHAKARTWHRRLCRWRNVGLTPTAAMRVAGLLGMRPIELWPEFDRCPHCGRS